MLGAAVAAQSPIRRASSGAPAPDPRETDEGRPRPPVAPERSPAAPRSEPPPDTNIPVIPESREGSLLWRLRGMLRSMRPHQWVKNLFVLAPMFFHKDVFVQTPVGTALNLSVTGRALTATGVFCLLAGAVYTFNDIADVAADRLHDTLRSQGIGTTWPAGQKFANILGRDRILLPGMVLNDDPARGHVDHVSPGPLRRELR